MAKQHLDYDRSLLDNGNWAELVKSLKYGIYDVDLPGYAELQRLRNTLSRYNCRKDYKYRFLTNVIYGPTLILRIEVELRK